MHPIKFAQDLRKRRVETNDEEASIGIKPQTSTCEQIPQSEPQPSTSTQHKIETKEVACEIDSEKLQELNLNKISYANIDIGKTPVPEPLISGTMKQICKAEKAWRA